MKVSHGVLTEIMQYCSEIKWIMTFYGINACSELTHFSPVSHFYPPENVRKPSGGTEM